MGAPILAGVDAAPFPYQAEQDLDSVALAVEQVIVRDRHAPVCSRRDARGDLAIGSRSAEPVCVQPLSLSRVFGLRQRIKHQGSAIIVAHLPFAERQDQRPSFAVANGLELGVQPAFGAPDTVGNSPFLSRLAVVRCTLKWGASIIS